MTVTQFDHVLPWTEQEYLALNETADRVEKPGHPLVMTEPIVVAIDPTDLGLA